MQGGMVEALSIYRKWKGYTLDYEGSQKLVFSLKEPNYCLVKNNGIRISTEPSNKGRDFKITGYFPDKTCSIVDSMGNVIAQVHLFIHTSSSQPLNFGLNEISFLQNSNSTCSCKLYSIYNLVR